MQEAKKQQVYAKLEELAGGARLTVDDVLAEAENPKSPLHAEFEWDDAAAARAHRKEQARTLIASFVVYVEKRTHVIVAPAYVRDPDAESREQGYRSVVQLKTDRAKAREALMNEAKRAAAYLQRVRALAVAFDLEDELDDIISGFSEFRSVVAER